MRSSPLPRLNYQTLKKQFNLIVDDIDEQNPTDIAYVYSGYAPLSIRLIQSVISVQYFDGENAGSDMKTGTKTGWIAAATGRSMGSTVISPLQVLESVPGPVVDEIQRTPLGTPSRTCDNIKDNEKSENWYSIHFI
jgi:hypothetical protein